MTMPCFYVCTTSLHRPRTDGDDQNNKEDLPQNNLRKPSPVQLKKLVPILVTAGYKLVA